MTFKQRVRFFFQGKPYLKVLAALLSAAAFAFCSLACMGLTNSREDYVTSGIYNYDRIPCTSIYYDHNPNYFGSNNILSQEIIDIVEGNTSLSYAYGYILGNTAFTVGDYNTASAWCCENNIDANGDMVISAKWDTLEEIGFSITAGRYPETVTEIAISETHYEMFKKFGYVNVYGAYEKNKKDNYICGDTMGLSTEDINDYSDIIGKTVVMYGDPETGDLVTYNPETGREIYHAIYEATIVGIVNTDSALPTEEDYGGSDFSFPANKLYVSYLWREKFFYKDSVWSDNKCEYMYARHVKTYEEARELAMIDIAVADLIKEKDLETTLPEQRTIIHDTLLLLDDRQYPYIQAMLVFGVPLCALAVVLQCFMTEYSFKDRRKQIGILQSLGMSKKQLTKMFILEAVIMSLVVLLIAVPLSYGVFYGWIHPNLYIGKTFDVYLLEYKVSNLFILIGMSLIIPTLATFICSNIFLKRAPIDNIRKFKKIRSPRISREEKKRQRDLKKLQKLKEELGEK